VAGGSFALVGRFEAGKTRPNRTRYGRSSARLTDSQSKAKVVLIRNSRSYIRTLWSGGAILRQAESTTEKARSVGTIERNAILLNGEWQDSAGKDVTTVINPAAESRSRRYPAGALPT